MPFIHNFNTNIWKHSQVKDSLYKSYFNHWESRELNGALSYSVQICLPGNHCLVGLSSALLLIIYRTGSCKRAIDTQAAKRWAVWESGSLAGLRPERKWLITFSCHGFIAKLDGIIRFKCVHAGMCALNNTHVESLLVVQVETREE